MVGHSENMVRTSDSVAAPSELLKSESIVILHKDIVAHSESLVGLLRAL